MEDNGGVNAPWVRTTALPRAAIAAIVVLTLVVAALAVVLAIDGTPVWWVLAGATIVLLISWTAFAFRVQVDDEGLTVRSALGFPTFSVPRAEIADATATTVRTFRDFGGAGIRFGAGWRVGVVLRSGPAIQVTRKNGRVFVVTVDDAAEGARLLAER